MSLFRLTCLVIVTCSFLSPPLNAQNDARVSGDNSIILRNGMNVLVMPIPQANHIEVTFSIQTGSIYESDSASGISNLVKNIIAGKITRYLNNNNNVLSLQNTGFTATSTTEQAIFRFTIQAQNIGACLELARDSLFRAKIYRPELVSVKNSVLQQIEDNKHDKKKVFEEEMLKRVYRQDHQRLEVTGEPKNFNNIDLYAVITFFEKYYVPNNTIVTLTGNISIETAEQQFQSNLASLPRSKFDPKTITRIIDIRPLAYTTQFIVNDTNASPEFRICWQFPGTASSKEASYCAYLLNTMLNDPYNYIQVKAAKMGCIKFQVRSEAHKFTGLLKITFQPSRQNLMSTYRFVTTEMERLEQTLVNETMINAGKLQFTKDYGKLKQTGEYLDWIVKSWAYNDNSYFPGLGDSVMTVTEKKLDNFVVEYLKQSPHVSGLLISASDRQSLKVDSQFTELDENVSKYVFRYRPNVTNPEGEDNAVMLHNLLQWLTINKDISAQVNGYADEHEYYRSTDDDSLLLFIDSIPAFRIENPAFKKSGYLRPEMMRALKIVKYLYDNGISAGRLSGTSMVFKSNNKKEELDNMKCTLTLNKYRNSPSLFEYHYGKKKK